MNMLPRESSYASRIVASDVKTNADVEVMLWAEVSQDPDFGSAFVQTLIDMGEPLPSGIYEPALWRLYCFKKYHSRKDINILEACAIERSPNRVLRTLIRCLLLLPKIRYRHVSKVLCIPIDVIDLYHELFFNVRDRMKDSQEDSYILNLVYPCSRQEEFQPGYHLNTNWEDIALRITYNVGLPALIQFLGGKPIDRTKAGLDNLNVMESRLNAAGQFGMDCQFHHQAGFVTIQGVRQMIQAQKIGGAETVDNDQLGLGGLCIDQGIMKTFQGVVQSDAQDRLQARKILTEPASKQIADLAV